MEYNEEGIKLMRAEETDHCENLQLAADTVRAGVTMISDALQTLNANGVCVSLSITLFQEIVDLDILDIRVGEIVRTTKEEL